MNHDLIRVDTIAEAVRENDQPGLRRREKGKNSPVQLESISF